ncbi:MAG: outer membrane beta-barrel protein [Bacteroidetes bacterium]|nr:outer membrane beta-barrel protein [Bacteroidota bacterium]
MKTTRILLLNTALLCAFSTFAQTEKGNILLGGTAGFDIEFERTANYVTIDAQPQIGFFVTDNLALGGSLLLQNAKRGDYFSSTSFGIAPFGRYYFGASTTKLFVQAQVGYITNKFESEIGGFDITSDGVYFGFGPGVTFFLNSRVAIEGVLAYTNYGGDFDHENFGLRIGVQVYLGGE